MAEDSLEDLFNKFFGDILGSESNPFSRQDPRRNASFETDPRRNALFETFRGEIEKGDKTYLKRAVVEYQSEVYGRGSDADLMQVYAKACVFVENIQVGYESLHRIKDPSSKQKQAMGILAYEMECAYPL